MANEEKEQEKAKVETAGAVIEFADSDNDTDWEVASESRMDPSEIKEKKGHGGNENIRWEDDKGAREGPEEDGEEEGCFAVVETEEEGWKGG